MDKNMAWFLGTLLSDGSITIPKYRKKGDETHIQYCIHIKDVECLYKIKDILQTKAVVHEYPQYKSPQCKIRIYDKKDIIEKYKDIKTVIPKDIAGYERHFIRGVVDGDGCIYHRDRYDSITIQIINQNKNIIEWISSTIETIVGIQYKPPRYIEKDHIYEYRIEGKVGRLLAWWLYHGDISECSLKRKHDIYTSKILKAIYTGDNDKDLITAVKASVVNENITPNVQSYHTLKWCHLLQKNLVINTTPVCYNKGKTKYYQLYINP